jgi:hypothetical protein
MCEACSEAIMRIPLPMLVKQYTMCYVMVAFGDIVPRQ